MVGFDINGLPQRLNCTSSTVDDDSSLSFGILTVKLGRMEDFCKAWPIASAMRPQKTRMSRVPLATWTTTIDIA
jgi:hypothetical protein